MGKLRSSTWRNSNYRMPLSECWWRMTTSKVTGVQRIGRGADLDLHKTLSYFFFLCTVKESIMVQTRPRSGESQNLSFNLPSHKNPSIIWASLHFALVNLAVVELKHSSFSVLGLSGKVSLKIPVAKFDCLVGHDALASDTGPWNGLWSGHEVPNHSWSQNVATPTMDRIQASIMTRWGFNCAKGSTVLPVLPKNKNKPSRLRKDALTSVLRVGAIIQTPKVIKVVNDRTTYTYCTYIVHGWWNSMRLS